MDAKVITVGALIAVAGTAAVVSLMGGSTTEQEIVVTDAAPAAPQTRRVTPMAPVSSEVETEQRTRAPASARSTSTPARGPMGRFDTDGDGQISAAEFSAMWERRQEWRSQMQARLDPNGDGEISEDEQLSAFQQFRERMESRARERLTRRFDLDGDGVLNAEEEAAMEEFMEERRTAMEERLLPEFDADGDGQLSETEQSTAFNEMRVRRMQQEEQAIERFDADADGRLDQDEGYEAFQVTSEEREQLRFIRDYDTDGDGSLGAADLDSYMSAYAAGDESADADGDGVVSNSDLEVFRDQMMADPVDPEAAQSFGRRGGWGGFGGRGGGRRGGGGGGGGQGGSDSP
ncbi:MAG: EF-hand domain-containing protein [Planctomycetota bacterium]